MYDKFRGLEREQLRTDRTHQKRIEIQKFCGRDSQTHSIEVKYLYTEETKTLLLISYKFYNEEYYKSIN